MPQQITPIEYRQKGIVGTMRKNLGPHGAGIHKISDAVDVFFKGMHDELTPSSGDTSSDNSEESNSPMLDIPTGN